MIVSCFKLNRADESQINESVRRWIGRRSVNVARVRTTRCSGSNDWVCKRLWRINSPYDRPIALSSIKLIACFGGFKHSFDDVLHVLRYLLQLHTISFFVLTKTLFNYITLTTTTTNVPLTIKITFDCCFTG